MSLEQTRGTDSPQVSVSESLRNEVLEATDNARFLDAYQLALRAGPLDRWSGSEAKLLAGRLANHLGDTNLYWHLTAQAWRANRKQTHFQAQRVYALLARRGAMAAWHESLKLDQTTADTDEEKAEGLVCQGICQSIFRDFDAAEEYFTEAQQLAPANPWVWAESSHLPFQKGEYMDALALVEKALAIKPLFRPALQRKADYLQRLQRVDEAIEVLEHGRAHLQSSAITNQLLAIFSDREDWSYMLRLLEEAVQLAPLAEKSLRLWFAARKTDAFLGLGRLSEAIEQALQIPDNKFYTNLVQSLENSATPGRRVKIDVPFIQQEFNTCAPATLSAITAFWQRPIPQETLIGEICYDGIYDFAERSWAERNGWFSREFKVTWDSAISLLDRGIPFILTTVEISSGHSQAIIGYDTLRGSLLIRDPNSTHFNEMAYEAFQKHYAPVGPRGFLLLPQSHAEKIADLSLPEANLFDLCHVINSALERHDRQKATEALHHLSSEAPGHRLTLMGQRAIAHYDQNPITQLEAVEGLLIQFPEDDRLLDTRMRLLRLIGRTHEASDLLKARCKRPIVPSQFWRDYAQELGLESGKTKLALRMAYRSVKGDFYNVESLGAFSSLLWGLQKRPEALRIQRLAVCLGEKKEPATESYFQMLETSGQTEVGLAFLQKRAIGLIAKSSAPTITLSNALDRLNRSTEARAVLEKAILQRPDDGDLKLSYARLEASWGNVEQCRTYLDQAGTKTRQVAWLQAAANLERLIGNFDQALAHYQNLAEISPLEGGVHSQIGWLVARKEGKAAAQKYLRSLGKKFPFHRGILEIELSWIKEDFPADAEERLTIYLQSNSKDAWARRELAIMLQNRRAYKEALIEAQRARSQEPYHPSSWQVEASVLGMMNRVNEARECLKRTLELDINAEYALRRFVALADSFEQKQESLHFIRGQFDRQPQFGNAISVYREVAFPILELEDLTSYVSSLWEQRPDLWQTWQTLLRQLIVAGRLEEAKRRGDEATARFPSLPNLWRASADVSQRLNRYPETIALLLNALRINPDWPEAICALSAVYRREGRLAEAQALLERSHKRNPLESTILGTLAELLWQIGKREEALAKVQTAVAINPNYQWGWNVLASWSLLLNQRNLALELARERVGRLGEDSASWLLVYRLAERPELAGERLSAALRARECEPRNIDAHDAVIFALVSQGRFSDAGEACHPAIFGEQRPVALRGREAWLLAQQGNSAAAIDAMKQVVTTDPTYLWGWSRLYEWYFSAGRNSDALEASEKVLRFTPLDSNAFSQRARVYAALARHQEAESDFRKALALNPANGFAGWQLLQIHLRKKDFAAAEETISIMRPHISPGVVLPSEILVAAKQHKESLALDLLKQAALELEIDGGAIKAALEALDSAGEEHSVNKLLTQLSCDPKFNPVVATLWADRIGLAKQWNRFSYLKKIQQDSMALESIVQNLLHGGKKLSNPLRLVDQVITRYPEMARKNTRLWASIGEILVSRSRWKKAADWLADWEGRADVQGWMVTNLVFSLHMMGKVRKADSVSQKILSKGLRDHAGYHHLCYLALSALERGETKIAGELLQDAHVIGTRKGDLFFKLLMEQVLSVQESSPRDVRRRVSATARKRLKDAHRGVPMIARTRKAEARAALQMARDAGGFFAWLYAVKSNFRAKIPALSLSLLPAWKRRVFIGICFFVISLVLRILAPSDTGSLPHSPDNSTHPNVQSLLIAPDPSTQNTIPSDGDASAQLQLGIAYLKGREVQKNPSEAFKWLLKAANQGNASAEATLGDLLIRGVGVPKSVQEAASWWQKAADQGVPEAECNLAIALYHGDGITRDPAQAIRWWHQSADQGFEKSKKALLELGPDGQAIATDPVAWVNGLRELADQGNAEAEYKLGMAYTQGVGVSQDPSEAIKWLRASATQGLAKAQNAYGNCYWKGIGTEKDPVQALTWYHLAAAQGEPFAEANIGFCYENGIAVPKDIMQAISWYGKAAAQGNKIGIANLKRLSAFSNASGNTSTPSPSP